MKPFLFILISLPVLLLSAPPAAQSALLTDIILFNPAREIQDLSSGNHEDYVVTHTLSLPHAVVTGLNLTLTHQGNQDEGPVREIWHALTRTGSLIGRLSRSEENPVTDSWSLDPGLLAGFPGSFSFVLSEQTSYNREKINLLASRLDLTYELQGVPQVPEPSSAVLLGCMLGGLVISRTRFLRPGP